MKIGDKFNRLLIVSFDCKKNKRNYWNCCCECGTLITVAASHLRTGHTKSCGCLKTNKKSQKLKDQIGDSLRKYEPRIASARRVWKSYKYNGDENCTITFDKFYELSQANCYYCGIKPSNKYNYFLLKKNSSNKAKQNGDFIYNGMDRSDNQLSHTDENCVACCTICNRAKNNRTLVEFKNYINDLCIKKNGVTSKLSLPNNNYLLTSMRTVYRAYKEEDLLLEDFYISSQMPCFYCNTDPSNIANYAKTDKKSSQKAIEQANFIYNGLDRVNSNFPYNKNNIVPCCKYCNFAKNKLSLSDFQDWIIRIKKFQK